MPFERLFIAEKPSLGAAIAAGLGKGASRGSHIVVGQDAVTWCFGHVLEMLPPEGYDEKFKQWRRDMLPIIPSEFKLAPKDKKDKSVMAQIKAIRDLIKDSKVVVNGGDPDREGQLIIDELLAYLGYRGPAQRIWLSALDDQSVTKALANLSDNSKHQNLKDAALARSQVDWLAGMNFSRAMTLYGRERGISQVLSIGRVQTPTLALVVARDRAIENFKPVDYVVLQADIVHKAGNFKATCVVAPGMNGADAEGRLVDMRAAAALAAAAHGKDGVVSLAERKRGKTSPPPPYSLSALQKEAGAKFDMGAQQVLDAAQGLYEGKFTSYPRTDCGYLPEEQFQDAGRILRALAGVDGLKEAASGADPKLKSAAWNTAKITAHHAIIPTGEVPGGFRSDDQRNLYSLIARNYILQFWPPEVFEATKIVLLIDKTQWEASGRIVIEPGFKAVTRDRESGEALPPVEKGDSVTCKDVEILNKKTNPPSRFTEGTLVEAMKSIHLHVTDPDVKARLKENSGIGTEATRASVIETLKKRGFLVIEKRKSLVSTQLGRNVADLAPSDMTDAASTAALEDKLSEIEAGKIRYSEVVAEYGRTLSPTIEGLFAQDNKALPGVKMHPCPECGKALLRIKWKNDFFWACSANRGYRARDEQGKPGAAQKSAVVHSEHVCPQCGKALARREGERGPWWSCTGFKDGCKYKAPDNDGSPGTPQEKPVARGKFKCPECGKELEYIRAKSGINWFICKNEKKHRAKKTRFFKDNDGTPILET